MILWFLIVLKIWESDSNFWVREVIGLTWKIIIFFDFVTPNSISKDVELSNFSISKIDFSRVDQWIGRVLRFVFLEIFIELLTSPLVTPTVDPFSS